MRKRRMSKVSINTKLIVDVIGASLIVQQAPKLINQIFPLNESLQAVAGVGAGYLAGYMLKRPDLANASIGLGVVGFVAPFVDDLIGGGTSGMLPGAGGSAKMMPPVQTQKAVKMEDYFNLNDYISDPAKRLSYLDYSSSY